MFGHFINMHSKVKSCNNSLASVANKQRKTRVGSTPRQHEEHYRFTSHIFILPFEKNSDCYFTLPIKNEIDKQNIINQKHY